MRVWKFAAAAILATAVFGWNSYAQVPRPVFGRGADQSRPTAPPDHRIFSDRVLFIRDSKALEQLGYDPYPQPAGSLDHPASFRSLMRKAGALDFDAGLVPWDLSRAATEMIQDNWVECSNGQRCLDTAPFRLLAAVFRPDVADFACGGKEERTDACGAEIRFEFELIDKLGIPIATVEQAPKVALIVEFSAPKLSKSDFKRMLQDWSGMAVIEKGENLAEAFRTNWATYESRFSSARIRLTAIRNTSWDVRQYEFNSRGQLVPAVNLTGEIDAAKWYAGNGACKLSPETQVFLKDFDGDTRSIDPRLLAQKTTFPGGRPFEVDKDHPADWRFTIAINSCSGCHSLSETGTHVVHVRARKRNEMSQLSTFLTGTPGPGYGEPTTGYYLSDDPGRCHPTTDRHSFNDLLRRHLFIDAVSSMDPSRNDWTAQLEKQNLLIASPHPTGSLTSHEINHLQ